MKRTRKDKKYIREFHRDKRMTESYPHCIFDDSKNSKCVKKAFVSYDNN